MTAATAGTREPTPPAPVGRPRRRLSLWLGSLLIVSGLAVLGWYLWEMYGTTYVSQQRHGEVVDELERAWDGGRQRADVDAAGGAAAGAVIRIPRFGDDYAVPVLEGVGDDVLAAGYGHFTETAAPGERGNYAVAAHRVTHGEPLRAMPELQPGDEVVVETAETAYTYRLTTGGDDLVVGFEDYWVVDPRVPTNPVPGGVQPEQRPGQRLITLTTCASVFETDDRMVAFGELVDSEPRGSAGSAGSAAPR